MLQLHEEPATSNHALQRTAPRVTAPAFLRRLSTVHARAAPASAVAEIGGHSYADCVATPLSAKIMGLTLNW
ncbi:MAG: hypothetical protein WCP60_00295 [bacterium]